MESALTIVLPTRPQPDTAVAIFLLKTFGNEKFPGVAHAPISISPAVPSGSFEELLAQGVLAIDVGGGALDHHGTGACASELVARFLGIEKDPSLAQLLAYAKRDDAYGKGTISTDPLDRAFGLSGLISALNKQYQKDPQRIFNIVLPLLEAHYHSAREHHIELPREVDEKKKRGDYTEQFVQQGPKRLRVAYVVSDKSSMPTFLRSMRGSQADVVVQKSEVGNRICILSRQHRRVNLAGIAALIRMKEAELRSIALPENSAYWAQDGKIAELPMWYVDSATNSILNVGTTADDDSRIPWDEVKRLVSQGLALVSERAEPRVS